MDDDKIVNRLTDEEKQRVKEANKDVQMCIIECDLDDGRFFEGIFKEPDNATIARYVSKINKAGGNQDGIKHHDAFVTDLVLSPSRDDYYEIIRTLPALSLSIAPKLIEGHGLAEDSKKKSF